MKEMKFEQSFFDLVNGYCSAEKINDIVQYSTLLITYVMSRINDVHCEITNNKLYICTIGNASISTSIISELLGIKATNIDDSQSMDGVWSIHLHRR
jgi:hypothetical protein